MELTNVHLTEDRDNFETISEIKRVCSLTFYSLLAKVRVATDCPETRSSPPQVILDVAY